MFRSLAGPASNVAVMPLGNLSDEGEAVLGIRATSGAVERVNDEFTLVVRNARPAIGDHEENTISAQRGGHKLAVQRRVIGSFARHFGFDRRLPMRQSVIQQIADEPTE